MKTKIKAFKTLSKHLLKSKFLTLSTLGIAFLSIMSSSPVKAQEANLTNFTKKLEETSSKNAQEKVYLHLDKPYYAIGDDIWFKAYTINAKTGLPSTISGLLYIELVTEKDSIAKQLKLPMKSGITWGDFKLTDSLSEGNYRIRAYTQWMRNAGPEFYFDKTIKIGNSWANKVFTKSSNAISTENNQQKVTTTIQFADKQNIAYANAQVNYEVKLNNKTVERGKGVTNAQGEITIVTTNKQPEALKSGYIIANIALPNKTVVSKEIPLKTTSKDIDVQFFPEGGKLVENLPNKIAIKAINSSGLGEYTTGIIVNSDGTEISKLETNKLGMGSFFINPIAGQAYKANLTFADGTTKTLNLPAADKSGRVLSISNLDSTKMSIKVYLSEDLLNKEEYNLIAQHNGIVYFSTKVSSSRQVVSLTVPKDSLPSGIIQVSLLSSTFAPLNERIVFVNNLTADKIDIKPENLKPSYGKRAKVDLSLAASHAGKPVQGSFSVAITNSTAVKPDPENETNILTKLLLTSDLVGYVEKPNRYFLNQDRETRFDLDNLLLTQGWRKIDWKQVVDGTEPVIKFPVEKKIQISGLVTKGGKPVVKGKVSLVSFSGGFFMIDTLTDAKGRFNFDQIEFLDSTKFVVQARTDKDRKFVDIVMDVVPGQMVSKNPNTGDIEVNVNQSLAAYLEESNKYFDDQTKKGLLNRTILLDQVNIVEKRKPAYASSNLGGAGNADAVFTAKDLETAFSLSQYLQGRIAGVQIRNGQAFARGSQSPMSIMLDGMNVGGEDFDLDNIVVQDIETVEILKSIGNTAIYGMQGGSGVIVITTKRGGGLSSVNTYTPGVINYLPKGYAVVRAFYSPKYDVKPDNRPDLRTTVFWEPQMVSDASGKAKISYFNTDVPGTYRIVIEGIDVNGSLARKVLTYEVK
ncbi:TonB-dependent receptor [Pedobacter xixiisoli]|uniref:TonB-dependent outer membrane receptor, SusC/RagA subfamily, signature region n=1 Tax=Pedobacter xixiisoli TaxID=1476464 RepID=A0A286AE74_9SPHI|nr:TonB-dependent receptor plug domain-containing protein [Pedobacter xixiisoli]SOD20201.1 TonB-dependent outer membrane receptor, SusC/RagA subfamily, signature region [Pedobacter xixiisoli]